MRWFRIAIVSPTEQPRGGPSKARNTAIAAARGDLLAFLDGDDLWAPMFLASQLAILDREPDAVLVWADSQPFGAGAGSATLMTSEPPSGECDAAALLTARCVVFTSTAVARRRAVVEAGGFDETLHRCEDFDLWLRLSLRGRVLYNRESWPPAAATNQSATGACVCDCQYGSGSSSSRSAWKAPHEETDAGACGASPKGIGCSPPRCSRAQQGARRHCRCPASSSQHMRLLAVAPSVAVACSMAAGAWAQLSWTGAARVQTPRRASAAQMARGSGPSWSTREGASTDSKLHAKGRPQAV